MTFPAVTSIVVTGGSDRPGYHGLATSIAPTLAGAAWQVALHRDGDLVHASTVYTRAQAEQRLLDWVYLGQVPVPFERRVQVQVIA